VKFIAALIGLFCLGMAAAAVGASIRKQQVVRNDADDADEVALAAIFEPLMFHSTSSAFRGGTLECWYGGGVVDLRDATLDAAGARLSVRAIFGGGQILVPDEWRVESTVSGIGAMRDVRPARERPVTAPLLAVDGLVVMGGIGVSTDWPEEALRQMNEGIAKRRKSEVGTGTETAAPGDIAPEAVASA
jgi:hypothetical protein